MTFKSMMSRNSRDAPPLASADISAMAFIKSGNSAKGISSASYSGR